LDQQISVVTRKVERFRAIQQVIAKSQLEDAELELKGLQARRANLERANKEPEPLLAPVDGVIAASNAVAGQMAEPNSVIFQIVDPTRLWVEALSFEPQETSGAAQGLFSGGRTVDLVYVGTGLADRNQSVPIHFAIKSDAVGLRAGQFMTVLAATADERTGIAVPREAVLRGTNGQSIIYEHSNAERFVPREVRIEQLDAARVLIIAGIEPGKRIVTQGAELLNQIR
jgi:cobalt-zinc-cadmium efflux system membrane fusion protein